METLKGYTYAKEDIKKGHLLAIMEDENGNYRVVNCIEICKDCNIEGHSSCNLSNKILLICNKK